MNHLAHLGQCGLAYFHDLENGWLKGSVKVTKILLQG